MTRQLTRTAIPLVMILVAGSIPGHAWAEAFCYITEVKHEAVSNAIQVTIKADGILKGSWSDEGEFGGKRQLIRVRFDNARLKLDEHYFDVDEPPVSTIILFVPQNATDGTGVVMEVHLSERSTFKGVASTDERSFVLTVNAPLRAESTGKGKKDGKGKGKDEEEFLSIDVTDGLVTIRALRADIHEVVAEVARQTGINITLDDAIAHKVNINLKSKPPLDVIRAIAAGYGLALSTEGDVHMVSEGVPRDLTTYNRSGTASFPMRYLRAEDAKELLPTFLTKYIHFNEEQNAVVATAPNQMLEKIQRDLQSVDLPPPLIMVEVVAVELTHTGDYDRDIGWLYNTHDRAFGTDSTTGAVTYEDTVAGGLTGGVIANTANLTVALKALVSKGKAKIRSNPRIAALNGKSADIFIGQDRFILVEYQSGGTQQERIEAVPVGVRLSVVPWTGGNGEITTRVSVDVSNISEVDPATGLPLLSSRRAFSTIRTRDGETIVIGGLRQRQREVTRRKIRILGDLPIIGPLFQSKSVTNVDTELVIFVTPRILSTDGQLLDETQAELRSRLLEPGDCGYEAPTDADTGDAEAAPSPRKPAAKQPQTSPKHTGFGGAWSIGTNRAAP